MPDMSSELENKELEKYLSQGPEKGDIESQRRYSEIFAQAILDQWSFFARLAYMGHEQLGRGAFNFDFSAQDPSNIALKADYLRVDQLEEMYGKIPVDHPVRIYNPKLEIVIFLRALNGFHLSFNLPTKRPLATPAELLAAKPE